MYCRRTARWALQGQAIDESLQLWDDPATLATIGTGRTDAPGETVAAILHDDMLGGS
jgi:hypothetical protein